MNFFLRIKQILPLAAISLGLPALSPAALYNFGCVNDGGPSSCLPANLIGTQLQMEVLGSGGDTTFKFTNTGSVPSFIAQIYWDDRTSLTNTTNQYLDFGSVSLTDSGAGVSFSAGKGNLPRPNTPSPKFVADFSEDADSPASGNGINNSAGEYLTVAIARLSGVTQDQVFAGLSSGLLRIGLHVQGIGTGNVSDVYLNGPDPIPDTSPVPEPSSYAALLSIGIGGLFWFSRRRQQQ